MFEELHGEEEQEWGFEIVIESYNGIKIDCKLIWTRIEGLACTFDCWKALLYDSHDGSARILSQAVDDMHVYTLLIHGIWRYIQIKPGQPSNLIISFG